VILKAVCSHFHASVWPAEQYVAAEQGRSNRLDTLFQPEPWSIPERSSSQSPGCSTSFGPTLAAYVASLVVGIDGEEDWVLKLADYDFSTARAQLVMSRPCLGPQSIPPCPAWRNRILADELLGEVETMVIMPDPAYYEHYHVQGREDGDGGREEAQKMITKIESIEARAATWCAPKRIAGAFQRVGDNLM
jgi:hypothetical protein